MGDRPRSPATPSGACLSTRPPRCPPGQPSSSAAPTPRSSAGKPSTSATRPIMLPILPRPRSPSWLSHAWVWPSSGHPPSARSPDWRNGGPRMPIVENTFGPYFTGGAPSAGTSEVQTLTIGGTPTGGTFKLALQGFTTAAITWSNVNATLIAALDSALEALPSVGTGNVAHTAGTVTAGIGTILLTFGGALANRAIGAATVADNAMTSTSPTAAVAVTTAGVNATARGARTGALLIRTDTGVHHANTGTAAAPTWTAL